MRLRSFSISDAEVSDGRTLVLACVPFDAPAVVDDEDGQGPYVETFRRGAFAHLLKAPNRTALRYWHDSSSLPYGFGVRLVEDPKYLLGEFRVAPSGQGDQMLALVGDGQLGGVSIGFEEGQCRRTVREGMRHVEQLKVRQLPEVSVLPVGAYMRAGAGVLAVRGAPDMDPVLAERERLHWVRLRLSTL